MELFVKLWEFVIALLKDLIAGGWTEEDLKALRARRGEVLAMLRGEQTPEEMKGMSTEAQVARWQELYWKEFGMMFDISKVVRIPERKKGFDRLIVVLRGLKVSTIFGAMGKHFGTWKYCNDLDADITSIRTADSGHYAVWVRDVKEADEANRNKPVTSFKSEECVTLTERLLHELAYFGETGQHLDAECHTICAGSRGQSGCVPGVYWRPGPRTVDVYWYSVGDRSSRGAVRSVVV